MALKVRPLTKQEATALERLAHSRTAPHRVVQRAQIVWASARGETVPAIARQVGLSAFRVRAWLRRFNRHSLAGLADAPREGP
jgi:putative transposase